MYVICTVHTHAASSSSAISSAFGSSLSIASSALPELRIQGDWVSVELCEVALRVEVLSEAELEAVDELLVL